MDPPKPVVEFDRRHDEIVAALAFVESEASYHVGQGTGGRPVQTRTLR